MNQLSQTRLIGTHPEVVRRAVEFASLLAADGIELLVVEGGRPWQEQAADYAKGRNVAGQVVDESEVVTWALPGYSWHQYFVAFDACPLDANGQPIWDITNPAWQKMFALYEKAGLFCGKDFVSPSGKPEPDEDHFQPEEILRSPSDVIRQTFQNGGVAAVWSLLNLQPFQWEVT